MFATQPTRQITCFVDRYGIGLTGIGLLVTLSFSAHAKELEEVVVTAQKRAENTQDIPLAVSALDAQTLRNSGFDGVEDLAFLAPSLQFGNFGPTTFLNIRGIGSENTTGGSDPGVALHVDGIYVGRPVGALFTAFDMERVEVLRGPQGTLYGRNATGGSVNLISRQPIDEFEGQADLTVGDYDLRRVRGAVNVPISPAVTARVVAFKEDRDGYTRNSVVGGTEANDADNLGFRGHLSIDFSDTTSLLLTALRVDSGGVGSQPEQRDPFATELLFGPGPPPLRLIADQNGPIRNDQRVFHEGKNTPESQDNRFVLAGATFEHDFANFTLKSITGYVETEYLSVQDNDQSAANLQTLIIEESAEQFTQEIQLISATDSSLQWIVGAFYFTEEVERFSTLTGPRFDAVRQFLAANVPGFNEPFSFRIGGDVEATSYAVFAQATYDVSETVAATLGLRYTEDEKEGFNRNVFFAPQIVDPVALDSDAVTGKLAIDWAVNDTSLLYGSYSRGYKSGGVSQTTVAAGGATPIFLPEFVDTFEVGLKSRFADQRVQLNLAAYTSDYTDLQFQVFGPFGPEAGNAGAATINGLEAEFQALVGDRWSFDGSAAYTDAVYDELITGPGQNFAGRELPRTPEYTLNLGVTGEWTLAQGSRLRVRLEGSYTDDVFYEFRNGPESKADDFTNVNLRGFWESPSDRYYAEAYVTNLTDQVQENNILVGFTLGVAPGDTGQEFTTYNAPRQVGLTFGVRF